MTQPDPFTQSRVLAEVARHGRSPALCSAHPEPVEGRRRLTADLGYDSLDRVTLAMELEEMFHLAISDDDCAAWCTVADVIQTIAHLRAIQPETVHAQTEIA